MTNDKTVTMSRELAEDRARFEKWHNEFYGPQDKFNPIRSLAHDSFSVGLGYDDPTVQAQFCAFRGALAAPVVERQEAWSYCPEYGGEELHHEEGEHKQCADCHQEWFSDIDYSEVVRGNLAKLKSSPPAPVAVRITLQQVLKAYQYADSHPHKYLRGTTNWCAAVAHELNACLDKVKELNQ